MNECDNDEARTLGRVVSLDTVLRIRLRERLEEDAMCLRERPVSASSRVS